MGKIRQPLAEKILENSESKTLKAAIAEWTSIAKIHNEIDSSIRCLCGQPGIKDWYELVNQKNGKVLIHIGANCIEYFTAATDYLPAQHLKKLGRLKQVAQTKDFPTFSQTHFPKGLIDYLWQNDVFSERPENHYHAYADYQRFSELVYKGGRRSAHTPEEYAELTQLWRDYIKPFLLGQPRKELHIEELPTSRHALEARLQALAAENAALKARLAELGEPVPSPQQDQPAAQTIKTSPADKITSPTKSDKVETKKSTPAQPSSYATLQKISRQRKNKRDLRPSDLNDELLTYLQARGFLKSDDLSKLRQAMKHKNYALNDYLRQPVQAILRQLTLDIKKDK